MKVIEYAVKYKITIYVLMALFLVAGIMSYRSVPLEEWPEVEIPVIIVSTVYPGVTPEDMERLVTNVIERELRDLKNVKEMTSTSAESVSVVAVEFETNVELDVAYQKIRERVDNAKPDLPDDAEEPVLIEISTSDLPIMIINVMADYDPVLLKAVADDLKDKIEAVPGVLEVQDVGGIEREIQVFLDPHKLEYYKVGVAEIINRIAQEHMNVPAGDIDFGAAKYSVRVPAEYKNVDLMKDIVIKAPGGKAVTVGDVGKVVDGYKERESYSRANDTECITLRITKRTGENVVDVIEDIKALLENERQKLPPGTSYIISADESDNVMDMLGTLQNSIITGLILVVIVLLFSMGVRNATFVGLAIPLSMLIAIIGMNILGYSLNIVVMFALIIALGMMVDNSIVVIENIYRHAIEGKSIKEASIYGAAEVAMPIITSTATTLAVFVPLVFWPGVMGEFMGYLPKTVIMVMMGTLFVALIINPSIASKLLRSKGRNLFDDSGEVTSWYMKLYKWLLVGGLDHPMRVMIVATVVLVSTFILFLALNSGIEFMPTTTPERAQITVETPQGSPVAVTDKYVRKIEKAVGKDPNVKFYIGNAGINTNRYSMGGVDAPSNYGAVDIEFVSSDQRSYSTWESIKNIRKELMDIAGAETKIIVEEMGPPTGDPVSVELSGDDYAVLSRLAEQAKRLIETIPGTVDIDDDYESGKPEIKIDVDREQAMLRGINTFFIGYTARTAINGTEAGELREGDDEYDIVVRYEQEFRDTIEDIKRIRITGEDHVQVPLGDVARVYTTGGKGSIKHVDRDRTVKVTADVSGRSSSEVMMDVKKLLNNELEVPPGYRMSFTGESEDQDESAAFLSKAFIIAVMIMFLILITQFNSIARPIIILGSVVMSMNGVMLGLLLTQSRFSIIMTGMGVISLAGVVVNNAIVLIDYTDKLKISGLSLRDALIRAGLVRFRPVILTAVTTILGMLPMAAGLSIDFMKLSIETGTTSSEIWSPMATAIIFGLAFATLLTLVMVPSMYLLQEKLAADIKASLADLRGLIEKQVEKLRTEKWSEKW